MNGIQHLLLFTFSWFSMLIFRYFFGGINWTIFKGLWFGFIASNPDIDILIQKLFIKLKEIKHKIKIRRIILHRWGFTHSILYPLFLYWLVKDFQIVNAKEFGLILFIPVIIHLIGDFRIKNILNEDKSDTSGTWQISIFPLFIIKNKKKTHRLGPKLSVVWMIINLLLVCGYTYWIYI